MTSFKDLFGSLLRKAVAASALGAPLLAGCGADPSTFSAPACTKGQLSLEGLNPATPINYAELRQSFREDPTPPTVLTRTGTKCEGAPDMQACLTAFNALVDGGAFYETCLQTCVRYSLATTAGGTASQVSTPEAFRAFLGPIDTTQEAVLLAWSQGYAVQCADKTRGGVRKTATGFEVIGTKGIACGPNTAVRQYVVEVNADGGTKEVSDVVLEVGDPNCAIGRRPDGLHAPAGGASSEVGAFLAAVAHLEAASVPAFVRLERELRALDAPQALRNAALCAVAEETVHAGLMWSAATRYGATVAVPRVEDRPLRGAFELALDNVQEGVVRETFGAAVAQLQAQQAQDAQLRADFERIAVDEQAHATLSWELHHWLFPQLSASEQTAVLLRLAQSVAQLHAEVSEEFGPDTQRVTGMPSARQAQVLVGQLEGAWAALA